MYTGCYGIHCFIYIYFGGGVHCSMCLYFVYISHVPSVTKCPGCDKIIPFVYVYYIRLLSDIDKLLSVQYENI